MALAGLFTLTVIDTMYWDAVYYVTGSNVSISAGSLTDVTGLSHAASANSVYDIEIGLTGTGGADTGGVKVTTAFSAAGATGAFHSFGNTSTGVTFSGQIVGTAEAATYWDFSTTTTLITMKSVMSTGANAGNITAQLQKLSGVAASILIGSFMKIKKVA